MATDMNEILPHLWLGSSSSANHKHTLLKNGINQILTIMEMPLNVFSDNPVSKREFICLIDSPSSDILSALPTCLAFIENARIEKQRVLVHCAAGVSRSAAVVIAYIMWKEKQTRDIAFKFVAERRPVICPNHGFMEQLLQFEGMMNRFKIPLLAIHPPAPVSVASSTCNSIMPLLDDGSSVLTSPLWTTSSSFTPQVSHSSPQPRMSTSGSGNGAGNDTSVTNIANYAQEVNVDYLCRRCRQFLFHSRQLRHHYIKRTVSFSHKHVTGDGLNKTKPQTGADALNSNIENAPDEPFTKLCTAGEVFVEESHYENDGGQNLTMDGKIHCPKCKCKIGSFTWMGEPCVCGTWIVPAFHISRQKVDTKACPTVSGSNEDDSSISTDTKD